MLDLAGTLLGLGVSMSGGKNKIFGFGPRHLEGHH